jgi:hypothetical protein
MSAVYKPKFQVVKLPPYEIYEEKDCVVYADPMITSKGRVMLNLQAGGPIEYASVRLLRNWLNDYINYYEATANGGVVEVEPRIIKRRADPDRELRKAALDHKGRP